MDTERLLASSRERETARESERERSREAERERERERQREKDAHTHACSVYSRAIEGMKRELEAKTATIEELGSCLATIEKEKNAAIEKLELQDLSMERWREREREEGLRLKLVRSEKKDEEILRLKMGLAQAEVTAHDLLQALRYVRFTCIYYHIMYVYVIAEAE